jgi:hypothetical protein
VRSIAKQLSYGLLLASAIALPAAAQQVTGTLPSPNSSQSAEPSVDAANPAANAADYSGPARYDEPPPPPFDYWQPTWMPCQSLRSNRSLVLGHLYWGADILGWASRGVHVPPLVTSSSLASGGVINTGDTRIRFGNEFMENNMRAGGRLTIGWWFDPNQTSGIEWHYFEVDSPSTFHAAVADGSSILARPFLSGGVEAADPTASDTRINAAVSATVVDQLTSTGIDYRTLLWASEVARLDGVVGYRHVHLADRVRVHESFTVTPGDPDIVVVNNTHVTRVDQFRTVNQFDGADLGLRGWWSNTGKIALTTNSRIAIGSISNRALINGYTVEGTGNNKMVTNGGVLATPTTAVLSRGQSKFGTVTELAVGLQWQPVCNWKFNLGYTWFYWSEVARAASQIDRSGTTNATFHLHTTNYWADGINGGFSVLF